MKLTKTLTTTILLTLTLGSAGEAAADDRWRMRLSGITASSTSGGDATGDLGFALAAEYRVHERWGFEITVMDADVEDEIVVEAEDLTITATTSVGFRPLLFGANFQFLPDHQADLYLGPVIGWADLDAVEVTYDGFDGLDDQDFRVPVEDQFVYGLRLGLDVPLGGNVLLSAGATYLEVPLELEAADPDDETGDLDPLVLQLGIGWRF